MFFEIFVNRMRPPMLYNIWSFIYKPLSNICFDITNQTKSVSNLYASLQITKQKLMYKLILVSRMLPRLILTCLLDLYVN